MDSSTLRKLPRHLDFLSGRCTLSILTQLFDHHTEADATTNTLERSYTFYDTEVNIVLILFAPMIFNEAMISINGSEGKCDESVAFVDHSVEQYCSKF